MNISARTGVFSVAMLFLAACSSQEDLTGAAIDPVPKPPLADVIYPEYPSLRLESPAIEPYGQLPERFTCQGVGISPPIDVQGVPELTQSIVLIMENAEEDANWMMYNIHPLFLTASEGTVPDEGVEGRNADGTRGYVAPCPAEERVEYPYTITAYALNRSLSFAKPPLKEELLQAMQGNILEKTSLPFTVSRL